MPAAELDGRDRRPRRVLSIQATEPAVYPPLIHGSSLMAEAGWDVTFFAAPFAGNAFEKRRLHAYARCKYHHVSRGLGDEPGLVVSQTEYRVPR
jgi:hypothetical protein